MNATTATMSATTILRLQGLSWRVAETTIIDDVSFDAAKGEFIALMGSNGAGKSTVMDLIAGLKQPAAGTVILDGRPLKDWTPNERARRIGHLPQSARADLPFTAEQLVLMGRYPHADRWFESDQEHRAVEKAMADCHCLALRDRRVATLSGGERQRVLLAACLAQDPSLLLLDEPSTFLDIDQQLRCFSLLRNEAAAGRTCIAVTHDLNLALNFCTRIVVLANGRVACDLIAAEAAERQEWLTLLSSRLQIQTTHDGRSWVSYR